MVIMTCGKICSGKSTYAKKLSRKIKAAVLSVDEIMLAVFGQDAGERHDEYTAAIKGYLFNKAAEMAENGINVILDTGLWKREERTKAREFFASRGIAAEIHFIDISDSEWQQHIAERNDKVTRGEYDAYIIDDGLRKKAEELFEMPDENEYDLKIF